MRHSEQPAAVRAAYFSFAYAYRHTAFLPQRATAAHALLLAGARRRARTGRSGDRRGESQCGDCITFANSAWVGALSHQSA